MSFVKVKDNKITVKLPIKNNKLKVQTVKAYFPSANGLTFFAENEKCGIEIENDEFQLIRGVDEYEFFYANHLKENNCSDAKRRRIDAIMDVIEGKENKNSSFQQLREDRTPPKKVMRTLHVGWKHRDCFDEKYKLMRDPIGGIKKIELNRNIDYSYNEIKTLCVDAMKNKYNRDIFPSSVIQCGNYQEEIFTDFSDTSNRNCKFWKFSENLKLRNSQLRLYLLSTTLEHEESVNINMSSDLPKNSTVCSIGQKSLLPEQSYAGTKINISLSHKNASSSIVIARNPSASKNMKRNSSMPVQSLSKNLETSPPISAPGNNASLLLSVPTIKEDDIKFTNTVLGRGTFGSVILSIWNGTEVAVKKIKSSENKKYVFREMNVMDKTRHPNLISIMAVCFTETYFYIIMEYFESTNLRLFILKRDKDLDDTVKNNENYFIALQLSKAISYLHSLNPPVLHKDIKPDNILLNKYSVVKLCDLGLSKICDQLTALDTTVGHNFHGTPLYMPPEILIDNVPGSIFSDIWSLACCIVELFTEKKIWIVIPIFSIANLIKIVTTQKKPCLEGVPIAIRNILNNCFDHEPKKRPKAAVLLSVFKRLFVEKQHESLFNKFI